MYLGQNPQKNKVLRQGISLKKINYESKTCYILAKM